MSKLADKKINGIMAFNYSGYAANHPEFGGFFSQPHRPKAASASVQTFRLGCGKAEKSR